MAKRFEESDRRRWFVKCPACKNQQFLRFFEQAREGDEGGTGCRTSPSAYVDRERGAPRCGKCDKPITAGDGAKGEWVAEFPDRDARGYHVHRLLVPGANLRPLIRASKSTDPWEVQSFYNRDLGRAVLPEGRAALTPGDRGVAVGRRRVPPGAVGHGLLRRRSRDDGDRHGERPRT